VSGRPLVEDAAIVVGGISYGEADRIVRLLLPSQGRISAMARGARGSKRRFQGSLDLGNRLDVQVQKGRGELWSLQETSLVDARLHVRTDYPRLALLAYLCEVAAALASEEHPEPSLFGLLDMALTVLDHATAIPSPLFRLGFETKALTFAGFAPSLQACNACGEDLEGELCLRPDGAIHHAACHATGETVSPDWVRAVEAARRTPLRDLVDVPLPPGPAWAFAQVVEAHTERALRSRAFLQQSTDHPPLAPTPHQG
jgi:DNA repair protein RecO (recombination protein O)